MRFALVLALVILATGPDLLAELSIEAAEQRYKRMQKGLEDTRKTLAKATDNESSQAERTAYNNLSKALNTHPEMQAANNAEAAARARLKKATAARDVAGMEVARKEVARTSAIRFQKAASIPELAKLITAWRDASVKPATEAEQREATKTLQSADIGLGDLFE